MRHYEAELILPDSPQTFIEAKGSALEVERQLANWKGSKAPLWMNALVFLAIGGILAVIVFAMVTEQLEMLAAAAAPGALLVLVGVLQSGRVRGTDSRKRDMALTLTRHLEALAPGSRFGWRVDARAMGKMYSGPGVMFTRDHRENHKLVWLVGAVDLSDGWRMSLMCQSNSDRLYQKITLPGRGDQDRDRQFTAIFERGSDKVDLRCSPGAGQAVGVDAASDITERLDRAHHLEFSDCLFEEGGIATRFTGKQYRRKREQHGWKTKEEGGRLDDENLTHVVDLTLGAVL